MGRAKMKEGKSKAKRKVAAQLLPCPMALPALLRDCDEVGAIGGQETRAQRLHTGVLQCVCRRLNVVGGRNW